MPPLPHDPTRNPHALAPDGSFRGGRLPVGLRAGYVEVDGKPQTEWLEFIRRMAERVRFIGPTNEIRGDWSPFYDKQAPPTVARLLAWPLERLGQRFAEYRELIEDRQNTIPAEQLLAGLFDLLTSAVVALDGLTDRIPPESPLRERAEALIRHSLAPAYRRWLAYYRAAAPVYFAAPGPDEVPDYLRDAYAAGGTLLATAAVDEGSIALAQRWTEAEPLADYLSGIAPDPLVFGGPPTAGGADGEILHAVGHVFFHGVYELFVSSALHLRAAARQEWESLQADPDNAPHVALILAYLRMRERQRGMLNGLTDRHLHFYYQRVLRTRPAPARPPQAYLALEARKNLPPTYLPAGTAFRGGKDPATGTERVFLSETPVTVGPAAIVAKRAVYRVTDRPTEVIIPGEHRKAFPANWAGRYLAAAVADSADGAGETELPDEQQGWYPFGHLDKSGPFVRSPLPGARLGLAIATHFLYLREGRRDISVRLKGINAPASGIGLTAYLTTEEGWLVRNVTLAGNELRLDLTPEEPAIVPYDEAVHAAGLATTLPVLRLEVPQHTKSKEVNAFFREARFDNVRIGLVVEGVRQLALSGSAGVIDPAKPFLPFGAAPRKGDVLYVGNEEVFQKRGAAVTLRWNWAGDSDPGWVSVAAARLSGGSLEDDPEVVYLSSGELNFTVAAAYATPRSFGRDAIYRAGDSRGFLGLTLRDDWSHAEYPASLARWSAAKATATPDDDYDMPSTPFHPLLGELVLDYELDYEGGAVHQQGKIDLFHLTPFGSVAVAGGGIGLMPDILPQEGEARGADAGALYLGISNWTPGSQLSLLLQIAEGTADPLLEKPADHVQWAYLLDNHWEPFPPDKVSDGTESLLQSGLVRLDLPPNVTPANTRFNDRLQWVRLRTQWRTEAVNRLVGIHAHGVRVVQALAPGQRAGDLPLPPGTIAKLREPRAGVKTVAQPYPTFGGAAPEERDAYFTRLSERLRHKARGITEWDVEHLVLGAFPAVERIICLQHVEFAPGEGPGNYTYHELKAGHVTVLLLGRSGENALRPYVSLGIREGVVDFLRRRMSCHVTLHVRNPLFEEVRVVADVRFRSGTDEAWALQQIDRDLIDHISPWHDGGLGGLDLTATVHRSAVVNFLEDLAYVDYVENVVLRHGTDPAQHGKERLYPTKLVSVLVSAPHHTIRALPATEDIEPKEVCTPLRGPRRRGSFTITANPPVA